MEHTKYNNSDQFFIEKFKNSCFELEKNLSIHEGKINIREENHTTGNNKEFLFEIIVLNLINEDDYGIVFSLIIESEKGDQSNSIELSILKGNGNIIQIMKFDLTNKVIENKKVIKEQFIVSLNEFISVILHNIENDYLGQN